MKLFELGYVPLFELEGAPASLEPQDQGKRFSEKELAFLYSTVKGLGEANTTELKNAVEEQLPNYSRNKNSLKLAMPRMYTLINGVLPLDMEDNAGWFKQMPETMIAFVQSKGHDVADNLRRAKIDAKHRAAKPKMNHDVAKSMFSQFWKDHQWNLDYNKVDKYRREIISAIEKGERVDVAFEPYFDKDAGKKGSRGYKGDKNYRESLEICRKKLAECWKKCRILKEDSSSTERFYKVGDMLNDALVKYNAAKRGLGISNKLRDPAQRAAHRSRIMSQLNSLRALVKKIEQSL